MIHLIRNLIDSHHMLYCDWLVLSEACQIMRYKVNLDPGIVLITWFISGKQWLFTFRTKVYLYYIPFYLRLVHLTKANGCSINFINLFEYKLASIFRYSHYSSYFMWCLFHWRTYYSFRCVYFSSQLHYLCLPRW